MGVGIKIAGKYQIFDMQSLARHSKRQNVRESIKRQEEAANPKDGEMSMADETVRMGRAMQVNQFILILQRLNPNLVFRLSKSDPTKYGIYIRKATDEPSTPNLHGFMDEYSRLRFITGMESGINIGGRVGEGLIPEFSIMKSEDEVILDETDTVRKTKKFKREIRGWRTALAALYLDRLITEAQIEKEFHISRGAGSQNWKNKVNQKISID